MKFSIKDFLGKCDQTAVSCEFGHIYCKKSLTENFIFCAASFADFFMHCDKGIIQKLLKAKIFNISILGPSDTL